MANKYDKNQTQQFMDSTKEVQMCFVDLMTKWAELFDEYTRNGIGDLTQEDLAGSIYENMNPTVFTTAVGSMDTKFNQIEGLADFDAHLAQIEQFANRR